MDKAVLGVDSCKKGWCGVILGDDNLVSGLIAPTIAELVEQGVSQHPVTVVAIDIPIGLPTSESREADVLARRRLGPRASSVFPSPMMSTMNMATHAGANAENSRVSGKGLSVQSFGILPKIRDVEEWLRVAPPVAVIEIHPEVSFAELHGAPLDHSKKTWAGQQLRTRLLESAGILLNFEPAAEVRNVPLDDILDAAAGAWSARRFAAGVAERIPAEPQEEPAPAIWV